MKVPAAAPAPQAQAEGGGSRTSWQHTGLIVSMVAAAVGYLAFALWSGWRDVLAAVAQVGAGGVAIALALSLVNYGLRFERWQCYLHTLGHHVPRTQSLRIYVAGFALTTTPGKAGEALRALLLRDWGVPVPRSLAAFVSERLSDLLAVLLLVALGLSASADAHWLLAAGIVGLALAFAALSSGRLLRRAQGLVHGHGRWRQTLGQGLQVLLEARRCHAPEVMAKATGLSLAGWAAEALAFAWVLHCMELQVDVTVAVFIFAAGMLAGALSLLPGGLGGAEAVMVALLAWAGVGMPEAVAATVMIRLTTLWFAVLLGAVVLASMPPARPHAGAH